MKWLVLFAVLLALVPASMAVPPVMPVLDHSPEYLVEITDLFPHNHELFQLKTVEMIKPAKTVPANFFPPMTLGFSPGPGVIIISTTVTIRPVQISEPTWLHVPTHSESNNLYYLQIH
ncbi:MAG: hypothetical protein LBK60_11715 [Verrucomicrobiales bacterium]|jgi:hypothetical protein|nr:hypothetical protein [Verrucomicrobiales bacterium]